MRAFKKLLTSVGPHYMERVSDKDKVSLRVHTVKGQDEFSPDKGVTQRRGFPKLLNKCTPPRPQALLVCPPPFFQNNFFRIRKSVQSKEKQATIPPAMDRASEGEWEEFAWSMVPISMHSATAFKGRVRDGDREAFFRQDRAITRTWRKLYA